jgi:hypothetical protein
MQDFIQKLGDLPLKGVIQASLLDYFGKIDEPRKLGYVVAQFLRPQKYFTEKFIPKYYGPNSQREPKKAEKRTNVSDRESKLFMGKHFFKSNIFVK